MSNKNIEKLQRNIQKIQTDIPADATEACEKQRVLSDDLADLELEVMGVYDIVSKIASKLNGVRNSRTDVNIEEGRGEMEGGRSEIAERIIVSKNDLKHLNECLKTIYGEIEL